MTDIVEEARNLDSSAHPSSAHYAARLEGLCQELADEVERLRTKLERAHIMWQDARIELKRLQEYYEPDQGNYD